MNNVRIAKCDPCNKYTIQQRTIYTPSTGALAIPNKLDEVINLCHGDIYVWFCLQCNGTQNDGI